MRGMIVLLLSLFSSCLLQGQTPISLDKITIEDGLSQGYVSTIFQDREGFLWFGTKNGLNRYDGRQFEVFRNDTDNPHSLSDNWVQSIAEEGDFLLIGTQQGKDLDLFHKKTKKFYQISLSDESAASSLLIDKITKNKDGIFLLNCADAHKVLSVTFPTHFWQNFPDDKGLLNKAKVDEVIDDYNLFTTLDTANWLLRSPNKKDSCLNFNINDLSFTEVPKNIPCDLNQHFIQLTERVGLILSSSPHLIGPYKLCVFKKGKWEIIPSGLSLGGFGFFDEERNTIWVQEAKSQNLLLFDQTTLLNKKELKYIDANNIFTDINSIAKFYYKDRSGIIWIGTNGLGLRKLSPRKQAIKTYLPNTSIYDNIFSSNPGELLYCRSGDGVLYAPGNENTLKFAYDIAKTQNLWTLDWLNDSNGEGWLATVGDNDLNQLEVALYKRENDEFKKVAKFDIDKLINTSELSIVKSNDGKIYINQSNYLFRYDPYIEEQHTFQIDLLNENPPAIYYLSQSANGHFWLGTSKGLIWGKSNADKFEFQYLKELNEKECASILTDPQDRNIVWIGTKGHGLYKLDTKTRKLTSLNNKHDQLPDDVIYGVLNDDIGNLWMSSNKGIITYNPKTGDIRNFTSKDGMQSDEFNTYAFGKSPNGELFFGGIHGLNVFHPDDLKTNPYLPNVQITNIAINNQLVNTLDSTSILSNAIEFTDEINLPYHQNSLSFYFAALEYSAPSKNTFSYYLEGAEQAWVHTSTDNKATYLNLRPGNYIFKIKAANGDGVWNEQVKELIINISPPWYRSNLAYLSYLILIGLGLYQYTRSQRKRLELKHSVAIEQQKATRLKELDEVKSKLYTNITHEFRTPLTIISGVAEQMQVDSLPNDKQIIKRNSHQLLNLVNQMLDLRKLESGKMRMHFKQGNIIRYIRYFAESFHSFAAASGIGLHFLSKREECTMDFDEEKIAQVLSNLLSNAVKFTSEGGHIYVRVEVQEDNLLLEIQDTGKGIPTQQLPYIFNRFYQVDDSTTRMGEGTGIGLTLVKELITAMKGEIQVSSIESKGTTFSITLPITNKAPIDQSAYDLPNLFIPQVEPTSGITKLTDANSEKYTILLIEDNTDVIHYLIQCLQNEYQLEIAMDGAEGIDKAIENTPDLIVSDVMMPIKDGFEVCQALKTDERTSHIPIVLLTAKADIESRLEGLQKGADAYLSKPFNQAELLLILQNQLSLRQKLQARFGQITTTRLDNKPILISETQKTAEIDLTMEDAFLKKINDLVLKDLSDTNFGMLQLMQGLRMSRSQIYKKVKALTGKPPTRYIRSIRLHYAKQLLEEGNRNVSEVAYDVGFSSPNYFSDTYFEEFGIRPKDTRKPL